MLGFLTSSPQSFESGGFPSLLLVRSWDHSCISLGLRASGLSICYSIIRSYREPQAANLQGSPQALPDPGRHLPQTTQVLAGFNKTPPRVSSVAESFNRGVAARLQGTSRRHAPPGPGTTAPGNPEPATRGEAPLTRMLFLAASRPAVR